MTRPDGCGVHPCGSRLAYEAGCRRDGCRLMMILHTKPESPSLAELGSRRPAEPYARIVSALLRSGYTPNELAARSGSCASALRHLAFGITQWVYPETAKAVESLVPLLPSEREVVA